MVATINQSEGNVVGRAIGRRNGTGNQCCQSIVSMMVDIIASDGKSLL
jgi:hypothetical protein